MKKTFSIFLSYLLITFNSFVFAIENNNKDILKIGVLAPFSGELKFIGETILYSINLALHDIKDNSIKRCIKKLQAAQKPEDIILIFGTHYIAEEVFEEFEIPFDTELI